MQFRISSRRENRYRYTQVIKIRILIKIFSKQFCVIRCRRQTALDRWIGEGGIPLLRTLLVISQNSREPSFWEVMELFCFSSICKFGSLNKPFATITSLAEPYFRFRGFILLAQTKKKMISMNYGSSISSRKPCILVRLDYILLMRDIYTSIPTWTHSKNSLAVVEAPSLKISSHKTSLKWSQWQSHSARESS